MAVTEQFQTFQTKTKSGADDDVAQLSFSDRVYPPTEYSGCFLQ